mgnify:CR=1 FL=1
MTIMNKNVQFKMYADYHQHPANRAIHAVIVPIITTSLLAHFPDKPLDYVQVFLVCLYFLNYGGLIAVGMYQYFEVARFLSRQWRRNSSKWIQETILAFLTGWVLLFLGHYIEGSRPALLDAPLDAIYYAPLHTSWGMFYELE